MTDALPSRHVRTIAFNKSMESAILAGQKTQTRRPIKPQPNYWAGTLQFPGETTRYAPSLVAGRCPYGVPGDLLHMHSLSGIPQSLQAGDLLIPTLEVTGVRVERLNDISRGDAMAEGCPFPNMADGVDPRKWYAALWDQIYGHGSCEKNPWVWVIEFRRLND